MRDTEEKPLTEKKGNTVHVLYTFFDQRLSQLAWERYLCKLPKETQTRILRYRRWEDRQAAVYGRLLLAEGLKRFGYTASATSGTRPDAHGRPILESGVDFNLSHSGRYVVCAMSERVRVGIDIEKRKEFCFTDLADCFSAEEWEEMAKSGNREAAFYDFWTMKESVLKGDGRGLSIPMGQVVIKDNLVRLDGTTWFLKELNFGPDYSCHLATNAECPSIEMQKVEFDEGFEFSVIGRLSPREHINIGVRYDLT